MKMFKKNFIFLCTICLLFSSVPFSSLPVSAETSEVSASLRSDRTQWFYKIENGKKYKRLYNHTSHQWVTDWIPVN